ncbi:polysaccharide lyase 8 family protein [Nonomuraea sp. PA05]|uniref:polysaccharide lyase 8 family protein n=1 Tax=Nonomuraea sp. PA05 TaxID=2604466 RepID=UPI0011D9D877|nr:polysaccharide lyase 8 family protein [Nonomuraea sp. PA05]TYB56434.1 polysaccharide lyase 8 family protein [Nonomuraea sp. PA05]
MRLPSRRLLFRLGGVAAAGTLGALAPARAAHTPDDTFVLLRRRWREVTAGPGHDSERYRARLAALGRAAARHRATMAPKPGSLWPDQAFPSFVATPRRLRMMAQAYALGLAGADLAGAVADGVEHYLRHVYPAGGAATGNWWHWQIGVPKALMDASLLVGTWSPALAEAVDHYVPPSRLRRYSGNSTAANRVDLCVVTLLRAMLDDDHARAALAVSALSPVFATVSEGDGFYRDGSFIQHSWVPYQGAYGVTLLSGLATLYAVLRGSPWELADRRIFDTVERSFAPFVHDGACMDLVRGRSVGRRPFGDHERGREIAAAVLLLGESATDGQRAGWQAMVKGWAARGTSQPMLEHAAEPAFHARLATVVADGAIPAAAEPAGHRLLPMSARAVHRRPGWCAALSMASHRVGHYEHGNGENLRGWHTGSGMLYWWAEGHGDQYSDSFWPTVDPYRLPGTTVSTLRLPDGAGAGWGDTRTPWRWVGGASDGTYAAVGQHLSGLESTMEAFKSWFFLDDAVVCLGAGITGADGVAVETIVDNRRTSGRLTVGQGWAHLDGHGGYLVPGQELRTLRERRNGRDYVTLWLDHGIDPPAASYVYLLLPGAGEEETRARARSAGLVRVPANTARLQAVHVPGLGLTAACFWNAGTIGGLTASAPCAVLTRERPDGTTAVTVADPRCDLEELTLTWARPVTALLGGDALLTGGGLRFERLSGREGASATVTVRLG